MSISKKYSKDGKVCSVTFKLTRDMAAAGRIVHLVGEFNDWRIHHTPLKRLKNGDFTVTLELEAGRDYQFRYLIDDATWINDWKADKYVCSRYGNCHNSVVVV